MGNDDTEDADVEDLFDRPLEVLVPVLRDPDEGCRAQPPASVPGVGHLCKHRLQPLGRERCVLHVYESPLLTRDRGLTVFQRFYRRVEASGWLRPGGKRAKQDDRDQTGTGAEGESAPPSQ